MATDYVRFDRQRLQRQTDVISAAVSRKFDLDLHRVRSQGLRFRFGCFLALEV